MEFFSSDASAAALFFLMFAFCIADRHRQVVRSSLSKNGDGGRGISGFRGEGISGFGGGGGGGGGGGFGQPAPMQVEEPTNVARKHAVSVLQ